MRARNGLVCTASSLALAAGAAAGEIPAPDFLEQYAATYRFRLGRPTSITPTPHGRAILFLRSGPRSFERALYEYDVASGRERVLLTADRLLAGAEETLSIDERARRERLRLVARGIASFELSEDGDRILVPLSGRLFVYDYPGGAIREVSPDGRPAVPKLSPDGKLIACVLDGELHVAEIAGGRWVRLTHDAGGTVTNGLAEFVAQEEMGRHSGFWWSPDSRHLACQQADTARVERLGIIDPVNPQRPPQQWPYPRAGTSNAEVRLRIVSVAGGRARWVEWDRQRYPYLATVTWQENAPLTILVQNRLQTEEVLLAVDASTAEARPLLIERDEAWIDLDQRMPRWLDDGRAFLWTTERRGARQLERRDRSGGLLNVITPLDAGMRGFVHVDEKRRAVYVLASRDPTQVHLERFGLDAGGPAPERLTDAPGVHGAVFSEDGSILVHPYSGLAGESLAARRAGGDVVGELASVAEEPSFGLDLSSSVELTTVGDDPVFHAAVIRPRDFRADRRYPVIVHVYGGPTGQMVRRSARRYLLDQWIADHGYVVLRMDGRGTPGRTRAWQRAVDGNLIDAPLADHAVALEGLGRKFPELDLDRVGIYGWSFGGYFSAMAVLRRPDVFHAAVAGAPVADWRDYDTHYTERYMGLPRDNASGYEAASLLTWAPDLSRPLLIIHGTADDNVYFMHSLKLAEALFKAGRHFELLPLPGFTHMVPDPLVTKRLYGRITGFFETHVKNRSPRGPGRGP